MGNTPAVAFARFCTSACPPTPHAGHTARRRTWIVLQPLLLPGTRQRSTTIRVPQSFRRQRPRQLSDSSLFRPNFATTSISLSLTPSQCVACFLAPDIGDTKASQICSPTYSRLSGLSADRCGASLHLYGILTSPYALPMVATAHPSGECLELWMRKSSRAPESSRFIPKETESR